MYIFAYKYLPAKMWTFHKNRMKSLYIIMTVLKVLSKSYGGKALLLI